MRAPTGAKTVISRSPSPTGAQAGGDRRMGLHARSREAKRLRSALRIITRMDARFSAFRAEEIKKVLQGTTARRIKLPLLHSCPGGVRQPSIHSPWRRRSLPQGLPWATGCPACAAVAYGEGASETEWIDIVQWSFIIGVVKLPAPSVPGLACLLVHDASESLGSPIVAAIFTARSSRLLRTKRCGKWGQPRRASQLPRRSRSFVEEVVAASLSRGAFRDTATERRGYKCGWAV